MAHRISFYCNAFHTLENPDGVKILQIQNLKGLMTDGNFEILELVFA
ncbi:MAG: hypothetical protein IPH97_01850 [Ignavibacteriales bacterium]|nr:hypothetical protein [Ignavibacteriales bacterium]